MGYQEGLSGLSGASSDLDVIGNNIANANTVGFKQGQAQFADVYANTIAAAVGNQIGLGTRLTEVQQQFSQGSITTTNQALDVAINGNGFFQLSDNGANVYSRNGVFQLNNVGQIVNASGLQLMGYAANSSGVINTATTVPLTVPTADIAPSKTKNITAAFNLNSQDSTPATATFSASDPTSYNTSTSVQVYDSLGGTHTVSLYFVKQSTGLWSVYGTSDNAAPVGTVPASASPGLISSNVQFDTSGNLVAGTGPFSITIPDGASTVAGATQTLTLDLGKTTQYGAKDGVTNITQDGFTAGELTNFTVGTDGTLTGNYSNGQTQALGQIVLANFNNQNGLVNLGGNLFQQTTASGSAQIAAPGSTNHGTVQGGAVESSNVDLTSELVNLITAQRNYQANAQTIKTQQTVDQTLMQL